MQIRILSKLFSISFLPILELRELECINCSLQNEGRCKTLEKMREGKNSCRRLERKSKVFLYQLCKTGNQNKIIILESTTKNSQGVVLCSPYNQCWHVIRFTFEHHRVPGEQISIVIQWGSKST